MIVHLDGEFETVDYSGDRSVLIYDNVENEDYPTHWHNAIEVIMPLVNSFEAICDGKEFLLEERDVLIIPAGTLHQLRAQPGRRLIMLFDNRSIADNPSLSALQPVINAPLHISLKNDKELCEQLGSILKDIYTLYSGWKDMAEVYIYLKLLTMLVRIKEYRFGSSGEDEENYAEKFGSVLRYIEQNYMYNITLEELANMAGYSKYHFSRLFKKYCHTSFVSFLNRRKIKAAELLLVNDDVSVTEAAMQVGFSSLTTFNRVFRDIKGCTPTEFRKLYRIANSAEEHI
ncbi:MAG: helix-turn-helix domain-containing protein [Ruminococcus sp.]|nr:helix-turn-helix domain-containing protein [Ruminococcus sp.]